MQTSLGARQDFLRRYPVPEDWHATQIGNLARVVGGGTPSRETARFWADGTIPWATPTDLTASNGKCIWKTAEKITDAGLRASAATRQQGRPTRHLPSIPQ